MVSLCIYNIYSFILCSITQMSDFEGSYILTSLPSIYFDKVCKEPRDSSFQKYLYNRQLSSHLIELK